MGAWFARRGTMQRDSIARPAKLAKRRGVMRVLPCDVGRGRMVGVRGGVFTVRSCGSSAGIRFFGQPQAAAVRHHPRSLSAFARQPPLPLDAVGGSLLRYECSTATNCYSFSFALLDSALEGAPPRPAIPTHPSTGSVRSMLHAHKPPSRAPLWYVVAAVVLLVGGGCDLPQPTATFPASTVRTAELEQPLLLGSSGIAIPATNGWNEGAATHWQATSLTIPADRWAHIEVSGGVTYARNPNCYYAAFPCGAPLDGKTTGPLFSGGSSRIHIGKQPAGSSPPTGTNPLSPYRLFPVDGDPQTAMAAYALGSPETTAQTLWVRRDITFGGSWDPITAVNDGYQYSLGGHQTVSVTLVPKPLRVTAPENIPPGTKGSFRADIVGPYQLRVPEGAGGGNILLVHWVFYPNDTIPDRPAPPGAWRWVYGCEDKMVCEYAPEFPGRMEARAYVEGKWVEDRSAIVRRDTASPKPQLAVSCTPNIPDRGVEVSCTATVTPATEMTVLRRRARGSGFSIDEQPNEVVASGSSAEWKGTAVAATAVTFTVRVQHNGVAEQLSGSASFGINARTWTPYQLTQPADWSVQVRSPMQDYPSNMHMGNFGPYGLNPFSTPVDSVSAGPNTGLMYYLQQPPFSGVGASIATHPAMYPPAGGVWSHPSHQRWYNDQNGRPAGTCNQGDVAYLRQQVERHEGVTQAANSHYGVLNKAFQDHRPDKTLEELYMFRVPSSRLHARAFALYRNFLRGPTASMQNAFDAADKVPPATYHCRFDFNPNDQ